ncbi:hypothetical protein [Gordonia sp. ABSL49_1]|uniref:DUF7572 family protein n=1 Tax=Gordonia sp. ABSL49_1 TaxID=2920941 RepID=UPI001F0F1F7D|nr:hypothetical protein [Gordonia sp. ABSL49_1]MCH5645181.1 hypothetical protein [Gordonia sp. ABSL49_1]
MTETATLLAENLSQFCPVTNHYQCSDGKYLLVTYPRLEVLGELANLQIMAGALAALGLAPGPVSITHQPKNTEVFLCDGDAVVLDSDGDPANGMTPLLVCDGPLPVADALASLGYTLVEPQV